MSSPNDLFQQYFNNYVSSNNKNDEFEVRFGTKGKATTKIDFDNVVQKVISCGFKMKENEFYTLKIQTEFTTNTGETRMSNIRTEISGLHNIQKYCKTNQLVNGQNNVPSYVSFVKKSQKKYNTEFLKPVNFNEYNFRVSYQDENQLYPEKNSIVKTMINNWDKLKKTFRLIKRTSFIHDDYPFRIDFSIVKSSKKNYKGWMKPEYNFIDSEVNSNPETYEIEIEALNDRRNVTSFELCRIEQKSLYDLKKIIKIILSGLQQSNFPIKYSEKISVLVEYANLIYGGKPPEKKKIYPRDFIGPSLVSLQLENIRPSSESNPSVPNITKSYTVTEKADGIRKLLYINSTGKLYFIDMNMNVQLTGAITKNEKCFNTILDGEHVLHNKNGDFINLYAAFDIYISNKKDLRALAFVDNSEKFRLKDLQLTNENLKLVGLSSQMSPIQVKTKDFYHGKNIFKQCSIILQKEENNLFEYEVDGLIFTPKDRGVGIEVGGTPKNYKITSKEMFKWKPVKYNTVDFLVTVKKDKMNNDIVNNVFENGINASEEIQLTQYKTLELRVGFDGTKHGYLNPCQNIIDDTLPTSTSKEDNYKPALFYPTNPSDSSAHNSKIVLKSGTLDNKVMLIEDETDIIENDTIVEFRYDSKRESGFNWIPIRVRHDKTYDYKSGSKNYGNAYHVAQNVWHSIHNPITTTMISSGQNIPDIVSDDNIYYNRSGKKSETEALRNFHNLYIKKQLILSASKSGDTLIDTSVGKAGDLSKWIAAKLSFVFGLDISNDNIHNKYDGACARYLDVKKKYKHKRGTIPNALFVQANSSANIRDMNACLSEKCKVITKAIFGEGTKDVNKLGEGVYKNYGKGQNGFNVVSCQFALHYFFENKQTLHSFLRNVSECCKVDGYFIGTCYDGKKIFRMLETKGLGEGVAKFKKNTKIWEIIRQYESDEFKNDETSIGYAIDVYQETINKVFREYLINFNYFTQLLENYGFVKLSDDELKQKNIPDSVTSFKTYYDVLEEEVKKNPKMKKDIGKSLFMSPEEKDLSFKNNCFIFKKIRDVDTKNVQNIMEKKQNEEEEKLKQEVKEKLKKIEEEKSKAETTEPKKDKPASRKTGKKLKIKKKNK